MLIRCYSSLTRRSPYLLSRIPLEKGKVLKRILQSNSSSKPEWYSIYNSSTPNISTLDFANEVSKWFSSSDTAGSYHRYLNRSLDRYGLDDLKLSPSTHNHSVMWQTWKALSSRLLDKEILDKRLKLKRLTISKFLDSYIHKLFTENVHRSSLPIMLELYFEIPKPRFGHLTPLEFENMMRLVRTSEMDKLEDFEIKGMVRLLHDLIDDSVPLTSEEQTKFIQLKLRDKGSLDFDLIDRSFQQNTKIWVYILSEFPENHQHIIREMGKRNIVLDRDMIYLMLENSPDLTKFLNLIDIVKLKYIHLDQELFEIVVKKLLDFEEYQVAKELLLQCVQFQSSVVYHVSTKRSMTKKSESYQILNSLHKIKKNKVLIPYSYELNPLLFSSFFTKLTSSELTKVKEFEINNLLDLLIDNRLPIISKNTIEILNSMKTVDLKILNKLLFLNEKSLGFNSDFHDCLNDSRFDKKGLSEYFSNETKLEEQRYIFKKSAELLKECVLKTDARSDEMIEAIKKRLRELLEQITSERDDQSWF